ncbi:hypothetical protein T07_7044 [Trichinella nelsoni]|uniref:Uncharacterized protein n=1 Tax=Trichinella nelsoni TaxID=6336 RepID=A0A0V0SMQ6_9BILA|nr:hypothetical protein T07_7044 [Trichinella nelsoni]
MPITLQEHIQAQVIQNCVPSRSVTYFKVRYLSSLKFCYSIKKFQIISNEMCDEIRFIKFKQGMEQWDSKQKMVQAIL